ncbi:MAG: monofunctional biosynthetic peptidoglycan transglycosylase [Gammaproteobacteria bacterium]|nr:monofunctional biosynthetic peptidoglycan transglycosylase [Gammaproteobacteria bacterium]
MSRTRTSASKRSKSPSKFRTLFKWSWRIAIIVLLIDIGYMLAIWPDWERYAQGSVPKSKFILDYEAKSHADKSLPKLRWRPVRIRDIPKSVPRIFLIAEDARFYEHDGIDTDAFREAMEYNWDQKRFVFGGSTISQQTVKNMFLSPSRDPLRKWHELVFTFFMENELSKRRILELYLNVAEFGEGIYGIEAASRRYYGKSASALTQEQAAELAATLPAPKKHNPATRTKFFNKKKNKIMRNARIGMEQPAKQQTELTEQTEQVIEQQTEQTIEQQIEQPTEQPVE